MRRHFHPIVVPMHGFAATLVSFFGPSGLLVPASLAGIYGAFALGEGVFPGSSFRKSFLGGCALMLAIVTASLQSALYAGLFNRRTLLCGLLFIFAVILCTTWRTSTAALRHRARDVCALVVRREWSLFPILALAVVGVLVACVAATWLPIWQWDALGYHLPFVNFVLQGGGIAELPLDVPYLSTYPRNIELLFALLRSLLPDDRLLDVGQLPLGLLGAGAIYGIARELGGAQEDALNGSCAWLLLPAVFLQLPTNYIDVGSATYFLLTAFFLVCRATHASLLTAGATLGLFLGTKPSVPPAAVLLGALLLWRGGRNRLWTSSVAALLVAAALGLEAYAQQLLRHGNPVWPAAVELGPIRLPGTISVSELLASGANTQRLHGPLWLRVLRSWATFDSLPVFDMRIGGLGPLFWGALPLSAWTLVRQRRVDVAALMGIALVTPDPAVARYVLAFPGIALASTAFWFSRLPQRVRRAARVGWAVLAGASLLYAIPGLTGEGPPLLAYAGMSWAERRVAVGAQGRPVDLIHATEQLREGEISVFDASLSFPYHLWRSDLGNRVVRLPDGSREVDARHLLQTPGIRLVAAGRGNVLATATEAQPNTFIQVFSVPQHCEVYRRR